MPDTTTLDEIAALQDALARAKALRQSAGDQLARCTEEFDALFHDSPMGIAIAQDARCDQVLRNAALDAMLTPSFQWTGESVQQGLPDRLVVRAAEMWVDGKALACTEMPLWRAAALGERVAPTEIEIRVEGREPRLVLASATPLRHADGQVRGGIASLVDITAHRRAEADLGRGQQLLEVAKEVGKIGFFQFNFDDASLEWSPGPARLFRAAGEPLPAALTRWNEGVDARDRERISSELLALAAEGQRSGKLQFCVGLPGGGQRWLESRLVIEYRDDGRPLRVAGVTIDITDQHASEADQANVSAAEKRARHEAQVASRAKDEFLALLGHELRNPLNAIATAVEVLNRSPADAPVAVSARKIIGNQTRHLAGMMDRLLDVGHVLTDDVVLTRRPMNLSACTQHVIAVSKADADAKSQTLRLHRLDSADAWISGDADRIRQTLQQLVANAIKYTPTGGRIEVELSSDGPMARLRVMDDGSIEPALLDRIFEPFVQAERGLSRKNGGLGIGLTLVRRLVELHGGSVVARSSATGSVFDVRLPTIVPPGLENPVPRRLLLVEDNLDALSTLRAMLEFEGHQVETATDGVTGLKKLLAHLPEVAILDIGLPGIDGYEIARGARAAGFTGVLIALTGYGQERDAQLALAAGFDAHLIKPAEARVLLGVIQG